STGRMMGRIEGTRPGSRCGAGAVTALAPTARAAGRCGTTGMRWSTHPANSNPAPAAGSATTMPTRTMVPRSTPNVPAIARRPAVRHRFTGDRRQRDDDPDGAGRAAEALRHASDLRCGLTGRKQADHDRGDDQRQERVEAEQDDPHEDRGQSNEQDQRRWHARPVVGCTAWPSPSLLLAPPHLLSINLGSNAELGPEGAFAVGSV